MYFGGRETDNRVDLLRLRYLSVSDKDVSVSKMLLCWRISRFDITFFDTPSRVSVG